MGLQSREVKLMVGNAGLGLEGSQRRKEVKNVVVWKDR